MCVERVSPSPLAAERAVGQYGGMAAIDDIRDYRSFRDWLDEAGLEPTDIVALAVRAAMRALPIVWADAERRSYSALPFLRANLVEGVAGHHNDAHGRLANSAVTPPQRIWCSASRERTWL